MIRLDRSTMIAIAKKDAQELRRSLEDAFIVLDKETSGPYYAGTNIEKNHPKLWELFRTL